MAHEMKEKTEAASGDAKRRVQRRVMRPMDFYWSDRWQRVIHTYQCPACGKHETDLLMPKKELERNHICA